jgi:hypothetical protein
MVLTSHSELGNTGKKTGFWLEEFAAPYYVFIDDRPESHSAATCERGCGLCTR